MSAPSQDKRALRRRGCRPMQAKTAVRWHVCPPSEAKSVVKEGHGPTKEENLLLMSCKPVAFERNRA